MYFYPRSPCGERRQQPDGTTSTTYFYPRSPCGERQDQNWANSSGPLFLSTLSLRRATSKNAAIGNPALSGGTLSDVGFLSTLSLRRATIHYDNYNLHCTISIHALLAESDAPATESAAQTTGFLSTLSLRRATYFSGVMRQNPGISIHALLAESDDNKPTQRAE